MDIFQKEIVLTEKPRGFHLVTEEIVRGLPELKKFSSGLAHFFLLHTSASLTVNENADPDVRADLEAHAAVLAPDDASHYRHVAEGSDDMPAHIKSSLFGAGVVVPVREGRLRLGTWQGLYLGEHRESGGRRRLVATLLGTTA
ncbi:MAG: secondary thiamine-phosphate synthase enzyme YjbQ [Elusimicrobiota bacterium]